VRAVVICADPEQAAAEPTSVATLLGELGCRATLARFDLGGLDEVALATHPPNVVIIEAADDVQRAQRTIKRIRDGGPLVDTPILIAVTLPRLNALDFSVGFSDFVLMPIVPAELYARMRQVDWRTATFGSEGTGVSDEWRRGLTRVCIPMRGRADSLNVAASAAVLLFEARAALDEAGH